MINLSSSCISCFFCSYFPQYIFYYILHNFLIYYDFYIILFLQICIHVFHDYLHISPHIFYDILAYSSYFIIYYHPKIIIVVIMYFMIFAYPPHTHTHISLFLIHILVHVFPHVFIHISQNYLHIFPHIFDGIFAYSSYNYLFIIFAYTDISHWYLIDSSPKADHSCISWFFVHISLHFLHVFPYIHCDPPPPPNEMFSRMFTLLFSSIEVNGDQSCSELQKAP